MGFLAPVASICAPQDKGQMDRLMERRIDGHWMLGYVMSFADCKQVGILVPEAKNFSHVLNRIGHPPNYPRLHA